MNEIDKMLEDMLASLKEKNIQNDMQQSDVIDKKDENNKNENIDFLLKELNKSVGTFTSESTFVNFDKKNKDRGFYISNHQVTQEEFRDIVGINPSFFQKNNEKLGKVQRVFIDKLPDTDKHPVENVSWFDAIYYCNKRSEREHLTPVYNIVCNDPGSDKCNFVPCYEHDVVKWNYEPCKGDDTLVKKIIYYDSKADGYRLPTLKEWRIAAKVDANFSYSGSDRIEGVAWYSQNSKGITHPVMKKNPNAYSLYDMSGNVWEWCWDYGDNTHRNIAGGSFVDTFDKCKISNSSCAEAKIQKSNIGFRILRNKI